MATVQYKMSLTAGTADLSLFFDGSFAIPRAGMVFEVKIRYAEKGLWEVGKFVIEEKPDPGAQTKVIPSVSVVPAYHNLRKQPLMRSR